MPSFLITQNANASFTPSYAPVMFITWATSGIGQAMAEILSRTLHGHIHTVIVARNQAVAEFISVTLPKLTHTTYEFVKCDINLMKNVHTLAKDLAYLGSTSSSVVQAKALGEAASVLTVLGAGSNRTAGFDLDDLGLKKHYSGWKAMMASISYNDLKVAENKISHSHVFFPEFFHRNAGNPLIRSTNSSCSPLLWLITRTQETRAEYMLFALLDADKWMYRQKENGDDIGTKKFPEETDALEIFWEHFLEATGSTYQ